MISITRDPIDLCKILVDAKDRSAGGTVLFIGSVRDHNEKGTVSEIYYEAYKEMAEDKMAEIENEVRKRWKITKFVAIHRIGNLKVGEPSVAVAVSAGAHVRAIVVSLVAATPCAAAVVNVIGIV